MVGLVIVSHSARLAAGVEELANQMVQGRVPIATAAGIDDPENPIGTDAMAVFAAIESVYSQDGVVILMDLGSALLSAELALEFLTAEQQANVHLVAAPLVEGTMAAAVQAATGAPVAAVVAEANGALAVKQQQLGLPPPPPDPATAVVDQGPGPVPGLTVTIRNLHGLHARPAALLVQTAGRFGADITISKGGARANAKSINQVATLGARAGDTVTFSAAGADADAALAAIAALADNNFGESLSAPVAATEKPTRSRSPVAAAPGFALGPAFQYRPQLPPLPQEPAANPDAALEQVRQAIAFAAAELQALETTTAQRAGGGEAAIFGAHRLILTDPDLLAQVGDRLRRGDCSAAMAFHDVIETTAAGYAALEDAYQQARAGDVRDAGNRVLRQLLGVAPPALDSDEPVILLAHDLAPSDTARLDPQQVLGVATEVGGATGHSAILARALGIPAVVGLGPALADVSAGDAGGPRRQRRHFLRRADGGRTGRAAPPAGRLAGGHGRGAPGRGGAGDDGRRAARRGRRQHRRSPRPGRGRGQRSRRRGPVPHRVSVYGPGGGAVGGGAAGGVPGRGVADGRQTRGHSHPRRRRRQAADLPRPGPRGQPLSRLARHPLLPGDA